MIPKIIHMCYKDLKILEKYAQNWKKLNPEYELRLYDDSLCRQFLRKNFSELYVKIFNYIRDGPIKADFWRVCVLYIYGGIYIDADVEPFVPISSFLDKNANFITCICLSFYALLDPIFIGVEPNNKYIKNCIDVYENKYHKNDKYIYWNWSIINIFQFYSIFPIHKFKKKSAIYKVQEDIFQLLEEKKTDKTCYGDCVFYNNVKFFNCRYKNYSHEKHKFI